jgi:hypothetical protein
MNDKHRLQGKAPPAVEGGSVFIVREYFPFRYVVLRGHDWGGTERVRRTFTLWGAKRAADRS